MSLKKDAAIGAGSLATVLGAGYADSQNVKYQMQKERDEKNADKVEEMKRKEESSGGDTPSTGRPKAMKKGGKVAGKLATRGYGKAR